MLDAEKAWMGKTTLEVGREPNARTLSAFVFFCTASVGLWPHALSFLCFHAASRSFAV
jgi:hypothetical protein